MKNRNHKVRCILTGILLALPVSGVMAGEWNIGVSKLRFDSAFSEMSGIDEDAWKLGLEAGFDVKENIVVGIGANVLFVDDNNRFSEEVVPVDGPNISHTADSSETGGSLYAYGKVKYPFTDTVHGNILLGYEHMRFEREINNCVDCPSEEVDMDAGFYAGAGMSFGRKTVYSIAYQTFLGSSDVKDQIILSVGKSF